MPYPWNEEPRVPTAMLFLLVLSVLAVLGGLLHFLVLLWPARWL